VLHIFLLFILCTYVESLCFKALWYTCKAYKICFEHFVILDKFPSNYVGTRFVFTRSSEQAKRAAMVASLLFTFATCWCEVQGLDDLHERSMTKYFHMRGSPLWTTLFIGWSLWANGKCERRFFHIVNDGLPWHPATSHDKCFVYMHFIATHPSSARYVNPWSFFFCCLLSHMIYKLDKKIGNPVILL
jgi:hypothetical protein